ncbi:hypothetical protein GCM10008986_18620 [Salinibacillus aidingensis]|uniref:Uncharacterized protein n=1 Tax=Salinibacillus aidingensis TaxID=237684 RepID=A0ABN1BAC4_9BACI
MRNRTYKRIWPVFIILAIVVPLIYYTQQPDEVYGNDRASIVKVIHSIEGYEKKSIEVLDIKDKGKQRLVGFLSDNQPGYMRFTRNPEGNYEWDHIEVDRQDSFHMFLPVTSHQTEQMMFVMNHHNEVAKMTIEINGQQHELEFPANQTAVKWMDLPESSDGSYSFQHFKYYDKEGNLLEDL